MGRIASEYNFDIVCSACESIGRVQEGYQHTFVFFDNRRYRMKRRWIHTEEPLSVVVLGRMDA